MEGGRAAARGLLFERFVLEILNSSLDFGPPSANAVYGFDYGRDLVFDITGTRNGRMVLVEVKATTPQTTARLRQLITQLEVKGRQYKRFHVGADPELILVFPGVLSREKEVMALNSRVTIWDGRYLRAKALELRISVPAGLDLPPIETAQWDENTALARSLISQLNDIAPGTEQWASYEKYCEELLNFLFVPPLNTAIPQSRDEQHANRRDFILPNYVMDGTFWQFMRSHYDAHYVVAEVKNLTGGPRKREILQVANYLNPHGAGLFSIILARGQMDGTAKWICREQWVQHNKLIIGLDDEDVRQMLTTKMATGDPAELIRQKIEDFRLGI